MKFRYIFIIAALTSGVVSFYYSKEIYNFYNKIYYIDFKKESPELSVDKAWKLYREKKYNELKTYLEKIHIFHPENKEIKKILGLTMIAQGNTEEGAGLILNNITNSKEDLKYLKKSIRILYKKNLYTGIVSKLPEFNFKDDDELVLIYGISLYKTKKNQEALKYLLQSEKNGYDSFELYYNTALLYEDLNKNNEAIKYMIKALEINPNDKIAFNSLIGLYRKTGQYYKAERLLRSKIR